MIPLSSPDIDEDDFRLVNEVLRSGYLASGPMAEQFEKEVAAHFGARFAVAVSSGTAALHLAVIAAGVSDGDFVITSPYSFVASANVILYERGIPVFVDIDPETLTIDPQKAVEALRDLAERRRGWRELLPRSAREVHGRGRPASELGEELVHPDAPEPLLAGPRRHAGSLAPAPVAAPSVRQSCAKG